MPKLKLKVVTEHDCVEPCDCGVCGCEYEEYDEA